MSSTGTDIYFYCTNPACGRRLHATTKLVGKKIKCSRCPTKIVVPARSQKQVAKPQPVAKSVSSSPVNFFDQDEFEKWLNDPSAPVPKDDVDLP
jgi:hypothetical protein